MSISQELGDSAGRFKTYVDRLIALVKTHEISSITNLVDAVRHNQAFADDWKAIWTDIAEADGGKISLTTAGAIIGAVLGGVGIAAMGGAIGLPLAFVLGLGGLIAGAEIDSVRAISQTRIHLLRIPKVLRDRIQAAANASGMSFNDLIVRSLSASFPDPSEIESGS